MIFTRPRYAAVTAAILVATGALAGCSNDQSGESSAAASPAASAVDSPVAPVLPSPYRFLAKVPSFKVASTTVTDRAALKPEQFSGVLGVKGGKDISPQLSWSGFPKKTKSFVVSMYDPEAPTGSGFWHWIVADIPASTHSLEANAGALASKTLPSGAFQLNGDAGAPRYIGAAPPPKSGSHEYFITVTALDIAKTGLKPASSGALLGFTINSHTLARATIVAPTVAN